MNKKALLIIAVLLVSFCAFALSYDTDVRQRSLSLYGVADASGGDNSFKNPAAVYLYNQDSKFVASAGYSGDAYIRTRFTGKISSLSLDLNYNLNGDYLCRDFCFGFNAAYGYRYLGIGLGCYGGASMVQPRADKFLNQSFFGGFERLENSQFFTIRLGAMYKLKDFSFGVLADNLFVYDIATNSLSAKMAFDSLSAGAFWSQGKYSKRGRLNSVVVDAGLEVHDILNKETRAVATGVEATIQLSNEFAVSLKAGCKLLFEDIKHPLLTCGLSAKLSSFEIGSFVDPFSGQFGVNVSFIK